MERFAERLSFNDEALCVGPKKAPGTFHSVQGETFSIGAEEASDGGETHLEWKYRTPVFSYTPLCLPRAGSSHSTPYQSPFVGGTGPWYRIVPS